MKKINLLFLVLLAGCSYQDPTPASEVQLDRGIALYKLSEVQEQLFAVHATRCIKGRDTSYIGYSLNNSYNHTTGLVDFEKMEATVFAKDRIKKFFIYP